MVIYRCDRCGEVYDESEDVRLLQVLKAHEFIPTSLNLCVKCQIKLQAVIKEFYKIDEQEAEK